MALFLLKISHFLEVMKRCTQSSPGGPVLSGSGPPRLGPGAPRAVPPLTELGGGAPVWPAHPWPLSISSGGLSGDGPASPTSPRSLDPSLRGSLEPQPSFSSAFPSGRPCSPKELSLVSSPLRDSISQHVSNHLPSGLQVREALQNQALAARG